MTTDVVQKTAHEVRLAKHLTGELRPGNFELVEIPLADPGAGEIQVRTDYLALAAAYVDLMKEDCQLPMPPFQVGARLFGGSIGTVVRSNSPDLAEGDTVQSMVGWCDYSVGPAHQYYKVDPSYVPSPVYFLSQGPTAYYGMADIAKVHEDDVVFVSGAAGGVGSLAGQIAKCRGAKTVIGSAGTPAKVKYLVDELGFDAAFDYHDGPVVDQLRRLAPDGITVFFDNVGGEQFAAAIEVAAPHARFALCGALAGQIGATADRFPKLDLMTAITRHLELRPFACYHTPEQIMAWTTHFAQWLQEGRFVFPHTTVKGDLADAPATLMNLTKGEYTGNVALQLTHD